jgi:hypothetical protein
MRCGRDRALKSNCDEGRLSANTQMVLKLIQSRFKGLNLNTRALEALAQGNSTGQIVGEAIKNRMGMAFVKNLNLGGSRGSSVCPRKARSGLCASRIRPSARAVEMSNARPEGSFVPDILCHILKIVN